MLEGPEPASKEGAAPADMQAESAVASSPSPSPVFPSLSDEHLERLGVLARSASTVSNASNASNSTTTSTRASCSVSDKEIESKFTALSLAFKTDKMTLEQRLQRQRRLRDLAENNMASEFKMLREVQKPQLEALEHACRRVSSAAEMYGAVQQEERLSRAMEVIDLYVESLKRLHQNVCRELEEKKRVLSENNIVVAEEMDLTEEPPPRTTRYHSLSPIAANPLAGTKRRASIAAFAASSRSNSQTSNGGGSVVGVNGDVAALAALSKSLAAHASPAVVQDARPGRWSAPSRVSRRVSLAVDSTTADSQPPPSSWHQLLHQTSQSERRDSRAEAYSHSNSNNCMSEIAELSESRRESAAEQVEETDVPDSCLMALGQNGVSSGQLSVDDDDDADLLEHHVNANGMCRGPAYSAVDHVALIAECWCRSRERAVELWFSVSKDSFRWLRMWLVCALLVGAVAILVTTLLPSARRPARP